MNISHSILAGSNGAITTNGNKIEIEGVGSSSSGWADARGDDFDYDE